jgi:N-acetylglucosaminyl-diphospho-decaprenol L-rhamnosyltransferase
MIRRKVYAQIGKLDEQYVMYSEELDWCKRAQAAGWRVVYLGDAMIMHHGGKSSEQSPFKHIYFQNSKLRYFRKFHGPVAAWMLRAFIVLSYGEQLLLEWSKGLIGHKRPLRQERVRTYWKVICALTVDPLER